MSGNEPLTDGSADREYSRLFLALVCLAAVAFAAAAFPALSVAASGDGLLPGSSPFPAAGGAGAMGEAVGAGQGGLGALNPGDSTAIGGDRSGESPFRSQDTEVHFVVTSPTPTYMRTGAYGRYTGTGWDDDTAVRPYDGPIGTTAGTSGAVSYEVTLERPATSLPTVWRPRTVSRDDVLVTDSRALRSADRLPAGTRYAARSARPTDDPTVLRASGRDYPDGVTGTYTDLPADTEARLTPFVDNLTADDDSPYETARTVERWLETEKTYSLNVSREPGDDVASEFVFEMERGYCEYFATSMAVMLRSQDIPARYVVGYSPGQRTGENEYTVRGMNAHAWVEVYFEDVGWVRFDPTPASERQQQERATLESAEVETATPADGGSTPVETRTPDDGTESEPTTTSRYDLSLNRSATPGATVAVTVTSNDAPVEGARVSFNGEPIGRTDSEGTVVGTIPYASRLDITVTPPEQAAALGPPRDGRGRLFAVADPPPRQQSNESFELETAARLNVSITPDGRVAVTAMVDDVPVRGADVAIDGERVGTTDSEGWATVPMPATLDNATLTVRRGSVGGEATLTGLTVAVDPQFPLGLPWTDATVNATLNGEPARNATVLVGGERVTTTGADGTASVTLPPTTATTVTVVRHDQRAQTTVDGLVRNLAVVVALAVGLLGAVGYGARRRDITPRTVGPWLRRLGQLTVGGLIGLAALADDAIAALWTRLWLTVDRLGALFARRVSPATLLSAFRQWLRDRLGAARSAADTAAAAVGGADAGTDDSDSDATLTIRAAWGRFVDCLSVARHRSHTPGELAAHAIEEDDIPPGAVATLRDAFRAVEYGQRDPAERVAAVEGAIETIEAAVEDGSDDPEGEPR